MVQPTVGPLSMPTQTTFLRADATDKRRRKNAWSNILTIEAIFGYCSSTSQFIKAKIAGRQIFLHNCKRIAAGSSASHESREINHGRFLSMSCSINSTAQSASTNVSLPIAEGGVDFHGVKDKRFSGEAKRQSTNNPGLALI